MNKFNSYTCFAGKKRNEGTRIRRLPLAMYKRIVNSFLIAVVISLTAFGCKKDDFTPFSPAQVKSDHITIDDAESHYRVVIDYTSGASPYTIGSEYGLLIRQIVPQYEQLVDQFLAASISGKSEFELMLERVEAIKPQLDERYIQEIEGMASQLCDQPDDKLGDKKLSRNELFVFNLFADVVRATQCSGIAVFGDKSVSGKPITARLLDWDSSPELVKIHAIVFIKHNDMKDIGMVTYLGFQGSLTSFNEDGLFAGILDSDTGRPYPSNIKGYRSYVMDLRHAVEHEGTLDAAAEFLSRADHQYAFNHNILFSDRQRSAILENDMNSKGSNVRTLRTDTSPLNPNISWGHTDAVIVVNSYALLGNTDNHTKVKANYARWNKFHELLSAYQKPLNINDLKQIVSSREKRKIFSIGWSNIYHEGSQSISIFDSHNMTLEVAFCPRSNILPETPLFEKIPVEF
jgi:hypothetical protein